MKNLCRNLFLIFVCINPVLGNAVLNVGIGKTEITPAIGTPSAGYADRNGEGMQGVHDPLLAIALFIDNDEKQIVLCSVDHLGFTYEMVQEITQQARALPQLKQCEIYIASSHTHSGGGAYLNIPVLGESLAGRYDPEARHLYVKKTAEAIIQASQNAIPSKIGFGYTKAQDLSQYRSSWPPAIQPISDVTVIKITKLDETPLAVLFNYAIHPTVLGSQNRLFSSDFVGYARDHVQALLGSEIQPIYFNGAQGDITPIIFNKQDRYATCEVIGRSLAKTVQEAWNEIEVSDSLDIKTQKASYSFKPQATPFGLQLPLNEYQSEMNVIVLDHLHAFITVPGELSSVYDQRLKTMGNKLGYSHVSIFGLTNDAHGYIILPESWKNKTFESGLSFGGENYGETIETRAMTLLKNNAPEYTEMTSKF